MAQKLSGFSQVRGICTHKFINVPFGQLARREYSTELCSGCSFSDAATGSDPDWLPVAGIRDAPV